MKMKKGIFQIKQNKADSDKIWIQVPGGVCLHIMYDGKETDITGFAHNVKSVLDSEGIVKIKLGALK